MILRAAAGGHPPTPLDVSDEFLEARWGGDDGDAVGRLTILASALAVGANVMTSADGALCDAAARRALHVANPLAD
jgi:hypothetical protein